MEPTTTRTASARSRRVQTAIHTVHAAVFTLYVLVLATGRLTVPGFLLWTALAAAVDQTATWSLWISAGRTGPHPNQVRK